MKKEQREKVFYTTVYVACDGTEFTNEAECQTYEKSAKGVIFGRMRNCVINEGTEDSIFNAGSDDNHAYVLLPKSKEDVEAINMVCSWVDSHNYKESEEGAPFTNSIIGSVIILQIGYDYKWWSSRSLESLVKGITKGKYAVVENPEVEEENK